MEQAFLLYFALHPLFTDRCRWTKTEWDIQHCLCLGLFIMTWARNLSDIVRLQAPSG